jgi:hypothetical protein
MTHLSDWHAFEQSEDLPEGERAGPIGSVK